jgi:hypothetical protein
MWGTDGYYVYEDYEYTYSTPKKCKHDWKPILLLTSTVYDCRLCGAKKEEVEDE